MKVLFVCSGNSFHKIVPFIKIQGESLRNKGIKLDFYTIKGHGLLGYLKNVSSLRKMIVKENYDIIHSHYILSSIVTLLTFTSKPFVLSFMGSDINGRINRKGRLKLSSYYEVLLSQLIQPFAEAIIVKSHNLYKAIYLKKNTYIIPNGVNFDSFKPLEMSVCRKRLKLPMNKKIVLTLCDPDNHTKNYSLFLRTAGVFYSENIEFINPFPIDNEQVPYYLNASDVFVLTSFKEGSPNIIKEAMACNIPIVSTDVGDVCKVIGKTAGCYITSYELNDFAEKIQKSLNFGTKTTGREDIKHLEVGVVAQKIIEVYKKILE